MRNTYATILVYMGLALFRVYGETLLHSEDQLLCTSHCLRQAGRRQSSGIMAFRAASFECFGRVQGVFFRKYTQKEATALGVVGWIRNTSRNTVEGEIQGPAEAFAKMKTWLRESGSSGSRIEKAEFTNEREIEDLQFKSFDIRGSK